MEEEVKKMEGKEGMRGGEGGSSEKNINKVVMKKGAWSSEEDARLITFIQKHGHPNWRALPAQAGLSRCGKSCRLRWLNYLRPGLKRGNFTKEEEEAIINLQQNLGNKWSKIASFLPGRTDNEIKNVWSTRLKKSLNKNERDHISQNKDEIKENKSTSSSCVAIATPSRSQEMQVEIKGEKKENWEAKESSILSNPYGALDYFPKSNIVDVDNDFATSDPFQENYTMFFNSDKDIEVFPQEIDFEFWEKWEKKDPISSYQSQRKEFETCQVNVGEEYMRGNECKKWLKNEVLTNK